MLATRPHVENHQRPAKGKDQRQRRYPGPAFDRIHQHTRHKDQREIVIEQPAVFAAAPDQKRRRRGTHNADHCQQRAVKPAQHHRQRRHGDQSGQSHLRPDQPVHLPRRQHTGKQCHQPRTGKGRRQIGRVPVLVPCPAADPFPRPDQCNTQPKRPYHPPERSQIAVFNAVLHEKHPRQCHRKRSNGQKPVFLQPPGKRRCLVRVKHKRTGLGVVFCHICDGTGGSRIRFVFCRWFPGGAAWRDVLDGNRPFFANLFGHFWGLRNSSGCAVWLQPVNPALQFVDFFLQFQMAEQQIQSQQ